MRKQGKMMILFCSWNGDKADVTTTLDLDALGVEVERVLDAETGETVTAVNDGKFALTMAPFGVRALVLE
jgi:hypothetical protein